MSNPDAVPACIKSLSSTTFVAEVTAPALAVLVPLLIRALNDRSMEVQRRTVVVIDNLVKLVRDHTVAATYLSPLVDGVQKIAKGAAFPEVRSCFVKIRSALIVLARSANLLKQRLGLCLNPEPHLPIHLRYAEMLKERLPKPLSL
jgi:hypothetical protein